MANNGSAAGYTKEIWRSVRDRNDIGSQRASVIARQYTGVITAAETLMEEVVARGQYRLQPVQWMDKELPLQIVQKNGRNCGCRCTECQPYIIDAILIGRYRRLLETDPGGWSWTGMFPLAITRKCECGTGTDGDTWRKG